MQVEAYTLDSHHSASIVLRPCEWVVAHETEYRHDVGLSVARMSLADDPAVSLIGMQSTDANACYLIVYNDGNTVFEELRLRKDYLISVGIVTLLLGTEHARQVDAVRSIYPEWFE